MKKRVRTRYSPRKYLTKTPPAYSVLKPETSSLSPSTKSVGVRPTSAEKTNNTRGIHTLSKNNNTINSKIS
jgi:hypothetical protein